MPRYVIERDIPDIGSAEREALRDAARKSNGVLADMKAEKKNIQWEHSFTSWIMRHLFRNMPSEVVFRPRKLLKYEG